MTELKKCPFCGGEAEIGEGVCRDSSSGEVVKAYRTACENIGCCYIPYGYKTKEEAAKAWNRRAEK